MTTLRAIFDTVKHHLLNQGRRAVDENKEQCQYRQVTPDGEVLKCAVGCLIPDDIYHPGIEAMSMGSMSAYLGHWAAEDRNFAPLADVLNASGIPPAAHRLLTDLQIAHDDESNWIDLRQLEGELKRIEREHFNTVTVED